LRLVRTPDAGRLAEVVTREGARAERDGDGALTITGMPAPRIAELAARAGIVVHELTPQRAAGLERPGCRPGLPLASGW